MLPEFVEGEMKGRKQEEERTGCLCNSGGVIRRREDTKKIQKEDDKMKLLLPKEMGGGEGTKMRAGAECKKEGRKCGKQKAYRRQQR